MANAVAAARAAGMGTMNFAQSKDTPKPRFKLRRKGEARRK